MKYTPLDDVQALAQAFGRDARLGGLRMDQEVEPPTANELLGYVRHGVPQSRAAEMRSHDRGENGRDGGGRRSLDQLVLLFGLASLLFLLLAGVFVDVLIRSGTFQEIPPDSWEMCMVGPRFWKIARKGR